MPRSKLRKLNKGLREYLKKKMHHKKGKGFIGDAWKWAKDLFRESPGEESKFSKYAKKAKHLAETVGDITGHEGIKKYTKKAADIADTVGDYGKRGVEMAENVGLGKRRRRKGGLANPLVKKLLGLKGGRKRKRAGAVGVLSSAPTPLSMGYGKKHRAHHHIRGGLSSKLIL